MQDDLKIEFEFMLHKSNGSCSCEEETIGVFVVRMGEVHNTENPDGSENIELFWLLTYIRLIKKY